MQGNEMSSWASHRNPAGTPVPKRRINVRKQHSLCSLPALPFSIKNRSLLWNSWLRHYDLPLYFDLYLYSAYAAHYVYLCRWAYIGSSHNEQIKISLKNVTRNSSLRVVTDWKIDPAPQCPHAAATKLLRKVLLGFSEVFEETPGYAKLVTHKIDTRDCEFIYLF